MSIDPKFYAEDVRTVTRIDFCVFTNKEVQSYSSVSNDLFGINVSESYQNYEPTKGGLVDLRLGTCDIYLNCLTCGLNTECPGHFGHTLLAEPVFHYGFLNFLKSALQCVCLQCSKLLVEKSDFLYKKMYNKKSEQRFKEIKILTKNTNYCYNCGTPTGTIKKEEKESTASIRLILEREIGTQIIDEKTGDVSNTIKKTTKILTPRDCQNILRNLTDIDCFLLGFDPKIARPEDLIIEKFPIPPVIIRPTAKIDFMQSSTMEDSLTLKIADIINANKRVRQQQEKEVVSNELSTYNQDIINLLQLHIVQYFDNENISLPKSEFKTGGRLIKSISERIKAKQGRVRSNLMGKRVDFSARSVITSDPYINIDEVGVPKNIAMELTIPEEVTPYNIKYLMDLVQNGRDEYPGANFVFKTIYKNGKPDIQKIDLKYRKKSIKLNIGDVVERHAINGDYVLFNRQPTLHKPSMMGHKIHVLNRNDIFTLRMNVSVTGPYNADFDGDEMNIHLAQSDQARNELKRLANVKYQIIGAKDSNPIIGCVQDALSGCYLLTKLNTQIKGSDVANFLCNTTSETKHEIDVNKIYNGHQIFSHIIPKGINNTVFKDDKKILEIIDGELKIGVLDKATLSKVKNSIIHFIWDKYGPDKTRKFIDDSQRLALAYLNYHGFTFGIKDCMIDINIDKQLKQMINNKILEYNVSLTQYENDTDQINTSIIETNLSSDLNAFSSEIGNILMKSLGPDNNLFVCIDSKSKGNLMNMQHLMGCVGQKSVEGTRIKKKVENRSLPIFHRDEDTPEARGFIKSSYVDGINSYEFFYDAMAGREGLIDTAIKSVTWETPIIIIDNNIPKYTEIGKWIDNLLEKNKNNVQHFVEKQMEMLDINNIFIPTMDYNGNISWGEISAITRHDPTEKLYEIKTSGGRSVIVTDSKSLLIFNDETNEFKEVLTTDIKIGDHVPVTFELYNPPFIKEYINISDYLPENECNNLKHFELNYNNGIFIGLFLSQGSILNKSIEIIYPNENIRLFVLSWINENIIYYNLSILTKFMSKLVGHELENKFIPSEAFIASNEFITGLLNGYFSGKCYITLNSINVTSTSKRLIEGILMLCSRLGIYGDIHCIYQDKTIKYKSKIYKLCISDHWVQKFSNKITLIENIKNKQLIKNICGESELIVKRRKSDSLLYNVQSNNEIKTNLQQKIKTLNNVVLDKIIEINMINPINHPKVYDLTIPSTFNFGLANGLQVRDTAKTGYVQRQLIKGLEDLIIKYDNTNRNAKNVIVQYTYGENGIDQTCQTELTIGLVSLNNIELESTFGFTNEEMKKIKKEHKIKDFDKLNKKYIDKIKQYRDDLRKIQMISNNNYKTLEEKYMLPVNLFRLTLDYSKNKINTELNPEYILESIEELLNSPETKLITGLKSTNKYLLKDDRSLKYLFEISIHDYLCPKKCIFKYGLTKKDFKLIIDEIKLNYIKALIQPGEMVGIVSAQSIGEPTSQITLNTKHSAGVASKNKSTTGGVQRIEELLHYSKDIKTPQMTIYFDKEISNDKSKVNKISSCLTHLKIKELITGAEIYYDIGSDLLKNDYVCNPFFINNQKVELSSLPFVFRIKLNMEKMHDKETTLLDIKTKFISHWIKYFTNLKNMKKNEKDIFTKISRCAILSNNNIENQIIHVRFNMTSFNYILLTDFLKIVLENITLKGIDNITNSFLVQERKLNFNSETGDIDVGKEYVVYTSGINMEKLKYIKGVNHSLSTCNDVSTTFKLYGIEAARQILINEFMSTFNSGGSKAVNHSHMSVLIDMMTHTGNIISIDRHGLDKIDSEPIARASFEKTMDHFLNAALFNQKDNLQSVSSRIMLGRVIPGGTGAFDLMLDTNKLENSEYTKDENGGRITFPSLEEETLFKDILKYGFSKNDFFLPI